MQSTKQSCIKKLRSPYFVLCTTFFGIFAYCEQCLWKNYHVYNLILCRMTAAVPPPAPSLVQHRHRTFLLSLQRRLLEVSYFGVSSSFFCCNTTRKSNWQLCWEMKETNLFFFQKKVLEWQPAFKWGLTRNNCFLGERLPGRTYLPFLPSFS